MTRSNLLARRFTLLELLISLALMVMLTAVLFAGVNAITTSWQRLRFVQAHFNQVLTLDRTLDTLFSNTIAFIWPDADRNELPVFVGEQDALSLAYLHRLNNADDGALRCVALYVNAEHNLVADYAERPVLDWQDGGDQIRQSLLASAVDSIVFAYADWHPDSGLEWFDQWDPERREAPLAIQATVFWQNGKQETWLRRTAGSGYRLRHGNWQPAPQSGGLQ